MQDRTTHIRVHESTKEDLNKLRHPGQSFDGIIREVINKHRRKRK